MALTISASDTELPQTVNNVFNQTLLRNAQVRAPYFIGTVPGELIRQGGSSVIAWRRIENLAVSSTTGAAPSALSELQGNATYMQSRSSAALSVTGYSATMAKYGNFVILNEEVDIFNNPGQFAKILQIIGINAGQSLNRLQRDVGEDNATAIRAGNVASDGLIVSKITLNTIQQAVNALDKQSAMTFTPMTTGSQNVGTQPILPSYWALCHPDVAIDVTGVSGFKSVETYAGQTMTVMGEFGTITVAGKALRFISSEDAGVDAGAGGTGGSSVDMYQTSGNVDVYSTLVVAQDAIGSVGLGQQHTDGVYRAGDELATVDVIVKTPQGTGTSDPYNEITTVAWKAWFTGAVLNANWCRNIRSAATNITN